MYGFKSEPYSEDIVKITSGVWWLSGVFISQRAAKKLVDNFPIIGPIDVWINYHFDDLNVYGAMYNCINQDTVSSSDNTNSFRGAIDDLKNNLV
jgi:GR25 family glycosyltransferase involved in LPS biosynthesis